MLPTVHIRREAFLNIVLIGPVDRFKRECLGVICGYRPSKTRNNFLITNATAFRGTKSLNTKVDTHRRCQKRLKELFSAAPSLFRELGRFHSHPEWGKNERLPDMSEGDIKSMNEEGHHLEIITVISSKRKKAPIGWENQEDGSIKGSFDEYIFHINAYILEEGNSGKKNPVRLKIVAPAALKAINRALGYKT